MGSPLRKCMYCRERTVCPTRLPTYSAEMVHDGRKYTITLNDFPALQCTQCGAVVLDNRANKRLSAALRAKVGLLSPGEIRKRREALGLSQKELAHALQISGSTLCRWETGGQIQQRCMDKFLRCFFEVEQVRAFLGGAASRCNELPNEYSGPSDPRPASTDAERLLDPS